MIPVADAGAAQTEAPKKKTRIRKATGKTKTAGLPRRGSIEGAKPVTPDMPPFDHTVEHELGEGIKPTDEQMAEALAAGMTVFEIMLVETYLTCFNGTAAYQALNPSVKAPVASANASRILNRTHVRAYLCKRLAAAARRTEEAQDRVLTHYQMIAFGDVSELSEYRRECCRYCYGIDHQYQFTGGEMRRAREQHVKDEQAREIECKMAGIPFTPTEFNELGGTGFNPKLAPVEDCPECFGDGVGREILKDTRNLSPAAAALFDGVEVTKDGIKVKHRNRDKALGEYAKIVKLYEDSSTVNVNFDADKLESIFGQKMRAARERTREMLAGRSEQLNNAKADD